MRSVSLHEVCGLYKTALFCKKWSDLVSEPRVTTVGFRNKVGKAGLCVGHSILDPIHEKDPELNITLRMKGQNCLTPLLFILPTIQMTLPFCLIQVMTLDLLIIIVILLRVINASCSKQLHFSMTYTKNALLTPRKSDEYLQLSWAAFHPVGDSGIQALSLGRLCYLQDICF